MKKLLFLIPLLALSACVSGSRIANDDHANYNAAGKRIQPVRIGLFGLVTVTVGTVETGLVNRDENSVSVAAGSAFSKTGLEKLSADTTNTRAGSNTVQTVGYDVRELLTDVSTNAAPTVEALGGAAGTLIHKAAGAP